MTIPSWWGFVLVGLAAWRTFQLISFDDVFDRPRRWILRLDPDWQVSGDPVGDDYRLSWARFMVCPYCFGFWIAASWWVAWEINPHWTEIVATPFALSAVLIALARVLSVDEET